MAYSFNESELTSEKSLWDVYKLSRRILPSTFQIAIVMVVTIILGLNSFVLSNDEASILDNVREWGQLGLSFSIATLGFLIAGFTIFSTLSQPEMMLAMMNHINTETGLPTLKYNFFVFMKVFIAYIVFSFLFLMIVLFGQEGGFLDNVIDLLPHSACIKSVLVKILYPIVGGSFAYLLLLLKSFIFNIYAIVMNLLRWEFHKIN